MDRICNTICQLCQSSAIIATCSGLRPSSVQVSTLNQYHSTMAIPTTIILFGNMQTFLKKNTTKKIPHFCKGKWDSIQNFVKMESKKRIEYSTTICLNHYGTMIRSSHSSIYQGHLILEPHVILNLWRDMGSYRCMSSLCTMLRGRKICFGFGSTISNIVLMETNGNLFDLSRPLVFLALGTPFFDGQHNAIPSKP